MPSANIKGRKYPERRRGRDWLVEFLMGLSYRVVLGSWFETRGELTVKIIAIKNMLKRKMD